MPNKVKLLSVVGARPQFVKLAPIARAIACHQTIEHCIVHTGQHYDESMSASLFNQLGLSSPVADLGVGSGTHGEQTAAMVTGLEKILDVDPPSLVLTYGDTNSTLAATLAASKNHVAVAHIEAGLRSFNRLMPEEINRLVADHCSDRLYAPTPQAMLNLENENLQERAMLSGDVMMDAVLQNIELAEVNSKILERLKLRDDDFGLVTVHRPVNTTGRAMKQLLSELERTLVLISPLVFPVHPRTRVALEGLDYKPPEGLILTDALPYLDNILLTRSAKLVITDSGGIQKEAAFLRTPCLTARDETEWTETVEVGVNRLVGSAGSTLMEAIDGVLRNSDPFNDKVIARIQQHFGDGAAATRIIEDCIGWLGR